jgi:hypothetical protein
VEGTPGSAKLDEAITTATRQLDSLIPPKGGKAANIKTLVRIGRAYEQIMSEIRTDLVIMAVRGCNALDLAVFGSTT